MNFALNPPNKMRNQLQAALDKAAAIVTTSS